MTEEEDDALLAIETLLRRPGQVFLEDWNFYRPRHGGPGISFLWLQDQAGFPSEAYTFGDAVAVAWDQLCDRHTALESWFLDNRSELQPGSACNFLRIEEGVLEKLTRGRTGHITLRFPVKLIREAPDQVALFEHLILKLLRHRADVAGVDSPPAH